MIQNLIFIITLLFAATSFGQLFNNRLSVQGYLKLGTVAVNDVSGLPMRFVIKRNSTVVWCQTAATNVPVVSGVFVSVLSGTSNCQSLTNALNPAVFGHGANTDTFVVDVVVDTAKDGFGSADDATFAGIDLVPSPLALSANQAEVANSLSTTLPLSSGGTGATTAAMARTNLGLGSAAVINTSGVATDVLLGNGTFGPAPAPANFTGNLVGDVTGTQTTTVVGRLQGRNVSATAPLNQQVLAWNSVTSLWEPTTPAAAPVTSVAGKTGVVTIVSADISDAVSTNTPSRLVLRDVSGNFSANNITANTFSSASGGTTNVGDSTSTSTTYLRSGSGGLNVSVVTGTGNLNLTAGSTSGAITIGNGSMGATLVGNTGSGSATTIQAGSGKVKIGATGGAVTAMGVCTISSVAAITTTAVARTCSGIPGAPNVAVYCSPAAALASPNTNSVFCRPSGAPNELICNTTVANTTNTSFTCMWMQP